MDRTRKSRTTTRPAGGAAEQLPDQADAGANLRGLADRLQDVIDRLLRMHEDPIVMRLRATLGGAGADVSAAIDQLWHDAQDARERFILAIPGRPDIAPAASDTPAASAADDRPRASSVPTDWTADAWDALRRSPPARDANRIYDLTHELLKAMRTFVDKYPHGIGLQQVLRAGVPLPPALRSGDGFYLDVPAYHYNGFEYALCAFLDAIADGTPDLSDLTPDDGADSTGA